MTGKGNIRDWLKVLVLLLDEAVVLVGLFFLLNFLGVEIPLPVTIFIVAVVAVFVLIITIKVVPSFHRKQVTGREGMAGLQGTVVQPLAPVGLITVKGERWRAVAVGGSIEKGMEIVVVEVKGLTLRVRLMEETDNE